MIVQSFITSSMTPIYSAATDRRRASKVWFRITSQFNEVSQASYTVVQLKRFFNVKYARHILCSSTGDPMHQSKLQTVVQAVTGKR
jgi:hypothetical protein